MRRGWGPALGLLPLLIIACRAAEPPSAGLAGSKGSASCAPCHAAAQAAWKRTPHARTVRPLEPADQELLGRSLLCSDESPALVLGERHARRYLVPEPAPATAPSTAPATAPPSRHRLLACRWDVATAEWATVERADGRETTWEEGCAACHTTGFSSDDHTYRELTVGCESCHGPSSRHAGYAGRGEMIAFAALSPGQEAVICAACHLQGGRSRRTGRSYAYNPVAGGDLFADLQFDWESLREAASGDSPIDHHQKILIRDLAGLPGAPGSDAGGLRCTSCHAVHEADHARHERLERGSFCYLCHETEGFQIKEYRQSCGVCEF